MGDKHHVEIFGPDCCRIAIRVEKTPWRSWREVFQVAKRSLGTQVRYLSFAEVAERLRMSANTFRAFLKSQNPEDPNALKFQRKTGRPKSQYIFLESDVLKFERNRKS